MKTNNLWNAALLAALTMGATACTNELEPNATDNNNALSIVASLPAGANTRLGYDDTNADKLALTWNTGDALAVYKTDFAAPATTFTLDDATANTKAGTFSTSNAPAYSAGDALLALYPNGIYTGDANGMTLSAAQQRGVLPASPHHYMLATTTYQAGETPAFTFHHLMAAVKLELTFSGKSEGDVVKGINLCGSGLYDKALLAADGTLTPATDANAMVGTMADAELALDASGKATVYLFVFPTAVSGAKVTATDGTTHYEFKLADATLEAGNVYKVAATMAEATADTWYAGGTATDYYIYNEQDLKSLAATVLKANNSASPYTMKNKTVHLMTDIDMGDREHSTIGDMNLGKEFLGTFDGHGRTITNILINQPGTDRQAFFGQIGTETVIKNLTVAGSITGKGRVAGIAVGVGGTIINCVNKVNVSGAGLVGGIAAASNGVTIIACENYGTVTSTATKAGGITGTSGSNLIACINHASVTATDQIYVGGIVGECNSNASSIIGCINEGVVTGGNHIGGVIGTATNYGAFTESYFTNNSSLKFAGVDGKGNGWNAVTGNTYAEINNKVTDMNAAIATWNAAQTDEKKKCPFIYQASTTPDSALPTLVKATE